MPIISEAVTVVVVMLVFAGAVTVLNDELLFMLALVLEFVLVVTDVFAAFVPAPQTPCHAPIELPSP